MDASQLATAGVQPGPGDTAIARNFARYEQLQRLFFLNDIIAELSELPQTERRSRLLKFYREQREAAHREIGEPGT